MGHIGLPTYIVNIIICNNWQFCFRLWAPVQPEEGSCEKLGDQLCKSCNTLSHSSCLKFCLFPLRPRGSCNDIVNLIKYVRFLLIMSGVGLRERNSHAYRNDAVGQHPFEYWSCRFTAPWCNGLLHDRATPCWSRGHPCQVSMTMFWHLFCGEQHSLYRSNCACGLKKNIFLIIFYLSWSDA